MRAQIFDAVAEIGKPASAYEIADIVSQKRGKRVAPNSVYRILDRFVANNLVRRVESANAFVANNHPGCLHDCTLPICDTSGTAVHVEDDNHSGGVRHGADNTG